MLTVLFYSTSPCNAQEVQASAQITCLVAYVLGTAFFTTPLPLPAGTAAFVDTALPTIVGRVLELDIAANTIALRAVLNSIVLAATTFNSLISTRLVLGHYGAAGAAELSTGRSQQAFLQQMFALFLWVGLLTYAWIAADASARAGSGPYAYTLWFICATWSFADLANHLLVLRVAKMPFPSPVRARSNWIMGAFVAWTELGNLYPGALPGGVQSGDLGRAACALIAVTSHLYYSTTVGTAIAQGLGVPFFSVPGDKQAAARAKGL